MKKICLLVFLAILVLAACSQGNKPSTLSFSEIEIVPKNIQDQVDSNLTLQAITDGENGYYIIFNSDGDVKANLEPQEETVTIKFDVSNLQNGVVKQNTFYLTLDDEHDTIHVHVNGESIPFDNITVQ